MKKHNLDKILAASGIVLVGRGKGRSKVVQAPSYSAVLKFVKAITATCSCCGRRLPVNHHLDKGHVCKSGNCTCK
jgi:hypothetical protein